jgi:hypothetical protein
LTGIEFSLGGEGFTRTGSFTGMRCGGEASATYGARNALRDGDDAMDVPPV